MLPFMIDQVLPGWERKLELPRGEQGDLARSFSELFGHGSGVVGHGEGRGRERAVAGEGVAWEETPCQERDLPTQEYSHPQASLMVASK